MSLVAQGPVLVTGAAGFIGYHLCRRLLSEGGQVVGVDNLNAYYDPALKRARLATVDGRRGFEFHMLDIADRDAMRDLFRRVQPSLVVHLAAQAGVRYSLEDPHAYIDSNLVGFTNILEGCRHHEVRHLVYASSSSVYGLDRRLPFSEHHGVDHPASLYAATKRANELMAHVYSHLYGLPATGLRFFTVYGPWGRPDMALFIFTRRILAGEPIELFNFGRMSRDLTYVDDIVEGVRRICDTVPEPDPGWSGESPDPATGPAPHRLYNIGNSSPVELARLVEILETALGRPANTRLVPMQPGDVPDTFAAIGDLERAIDFRPSTGIEEGVNRFVAWYREYYG